MASFTQQLDFVYAHTLAKRLAGPVDVFFKNYPFTAWLVSKGRVLDGGTHIERPIEVGENESVTSLVPGGSVTIKDTQPLRVARYEWAHVTAHIKRSLLYERMNAGTSKMLDIVSSLISNMEKSFNKKMETYAFADNSSGPDPLGLRALVDTDPTSGTIGSHNRASEPWWRNQSITSIGEFQVNGIDEMRDMRLTIEEYNGKVDGIFTTKEIVSAYEASALDLLYITPGSKLDFGFPGVVWDGVPIVPSPACPSGYMYMLDSSALSLEKLGNGQPLLSEQDQDWIAPTNEPDTRIKHWLATLQLCIWGPPRCGVLSGITVS